MSLSGLALIGWGVYKWRMALSPYGDFIRHHVDWGRRVLMTGLLVTESNADWAD